MIYSNNIIHLLIINGCQTKSGWNVDRPLSWSLIVLGLSCQGFIAKETLSSPFGEELRREDPIRNRISPHR